MYWICRFGCVSRPGRNRLQSQAANCRDFAVLYLMSDDMRNEINAAYGQKEMITPFLDSLAAKSMTFDNAVTQYAYW